MAARSTRVFTLVFVHTPLDMQSGHRVLLGFKNRGFAAGTWTNFGGKVEGAESLEAAALRELREEASIDAEDLQPCGLITFEYDCEPVLMQVHFFTVTRFTGQPTESEEMRPEWFSIAELPLHNMWKDVPIWLPYLLAMKPFVGHMLYRGHSTLLRVQLEEMAPRAFAALDQRLQRLREIMANCCGPAVNFGPGIPGLARQ